MNHFYRQIYYFETFDFMCAKYATFISKFDSSVQFMQNCFTNANCGRKLCKWDGYFFLPFLVILTYKTKSKGKFRRHLYRSLEIREMTLFGNETQQSSKFKQTYFVGVCLFPSLLRLIKTDSGRRK